MVSLSIKRREGLEVRKKSVNGVFCWTHIHICSKQCVNTSTHMSGHTLDVIMCRATDNLIQEVKVGDMITDHNLLLCTVHHPKPHLQEKKIVTRKL